MHVKKRCIAVVTGSRADYGLLSGLAKRISKTKNLNLKLIVTGTHLDQRFGEMWRNIKKDGLKISAKVDIKLSNDSQLSIARSTGICCAKIANVLKKIRPDLLVVLGDRFEILGAASAALLMNVPIAHIHGGEITEGAVDEQIRHALVKMSSIHFPANKVYARRIQQMGENPQRIYNLGTLAVDNISETAQMKKSEIENVLGRSLNKKIFLVTYHPVTLRNSSELPAIEALTGALEEFPEASVIITGVNSDAGHRAVQQHLKNYAIKNSNRVSFHLTLGDKIYINLMRLTSVVIGNSSTGIFHAPILQIPSVNIGDRQKGRIRAPSVIDVSENKKNIYAGIKKALSPSFVKKIGSQKNPYGKPGVAKRFVYVLKTVNLRMLNKKKFFDILT